MRRTDWMILAFLNASSVLFSVNFVLAQSPLIGIIAFTLFVGGASTILGKLFYTRENELFKVVFGVVTLLTLLALTGTAFILSGQFTATVSLVTLVGITLGLDIALVEIGRKKVDEVSAAATMEEAEEKDDIKSLVHVFPFALSCIVAFGLLWLSRTGEGGSSVWLAIPSFFGWVYLICAFSLTIILFFINLRQSIKLASLCVFSFLSHSLFLLVWYPGRYGDPWSHLGDTRYILKTGMPYGYSWLIQKSLWVDLVNYRAYNALGAFFNRMLYVDIYWIHILLVPVLWSVFTPLLAFKIAETFSVERSKAFPLLAGLVTVVFSSLVGWGAISVPNSLGFIFFFVSIALLLVWMKYGGRAIWFVALLTAVASFFAHPQPGIFNFMFIFLVTVVKKTSRKAFWIAGFLPMLASYPLALYFQKAAFAPTGLFQVSNFLIFQSQISTLLLIFALVGLVLGIRNRYVDSKISLLLFVFYVVVLWEYYFTSYGMINMPFSPARILVMADFLLVPLVALGFWALIAPLRKAFSQTKKSVSSSLSSRRFNIKVDPRVLGLLLVSLFLSLQATVVLYQAYPQSEVQRFQPSAYELEAIQYIDSHSSERYVVLCEPTFGALAIGFLGKDYAWLGGERGLFGYPVWSYMYPTLQMYTEMTKTPSIGVMERAMRFANAELSYFVVSVRDPNFEEIVERTLEILPAYRIFADGKLYVFMYPLPIVEEPGSMVKVVFDDGLGGEQNVETRFVYMVENEINSTLTLTGYNSYNVTEFPMHWTFLELTVNNVSRRFDDSSDINTFVYVRGLQPSDVLTIKWLFNRRYTVVGWKEDSFKRLDKWRTHELYTGTIMPNITSDGDVLRMSYSFKPGPYQYYYYVTSVGLSTNDYPYLLMRWRSDRPVAVGAVYFEFGWESTTPRNQRTVAEGSISPEWSTIVVPLESNNVVRTVMVGLTNLKNKSLEGQATVEIDYILLSAEATP